MRGKPFILKALSWVARITPAGAGKTGVFVGNLLEGQDHPRRCGENAYQYILSPLSAGSPPQVRGKRTPHQTKTKPIGITPAGAGKTAKKRVRRRYTRDHPRGCGENFAEILSLEGGAGSPPRMRGKRWGVQNGWLSDRITPADAGKTLLFFGGQYVVRDHPRGCGENQTHPQTRQSKTGSPPRMRGKRFAFGQLRPRAGITPADAGKTFAEAYRDVLR